MLNWLEVSRKKLLENFDYVKKNLTPECMVMSVVKANAYGHGLVEVVKILEEKTHWFAVVSIDEAKKIRQVGIKKPVLVLGFIEDEDYKDLFEYKITPSVYSLAVMEKISKTALELREEIDIHIKIDTGMNRLGFKLEEIDRLIDELKINKKLKIQGLYSHFYNENNREICLQQIELMNEAIRIFKQHDLSVPIVHMTKSQPHVEFPEAHFNMVRVGGILYGLAPYTQGVSPIVNFKAKVAMIKKVKRGMAVGYDGCYVADQDKVVAVVTAGYADGFRSFEPNKGTVLINGKKCPILGRICMNQAMVDVAGIGKIEVGDEAVLIGEQKGEVITPMNYAAETKCVVYETTARIPDHVNRIYLD